MSYDKIETVSQEFVNGEHPDMVEVEVEPGVIVLFDNAHEQDYKEGKAVCNISIDKSVHTQFDPKHFEENFSGIVSEIETIFEDVFTSYSGPEHDTNNSTDEYESYVYTLYV